MLAVRSTTGPADLEAGAGCSEEVGWGSGLSAAVQPGNSAATRAALLAVRSKRLDVSDNVSRLATEAPRQPIHGSHPHIAQTTRGGMG
jgi:hypothetical protein